MNFIAIVVAVFLAFSSSLNAEETRGGRPNIVLIFMDDLGYGDIGPFGSVKNRTPNLDRMAKEGMKLTSFYAATVCSVSRAQVMTGCYGQRVSIPGVLSPGSAAGINPHEQTVAELMKERGYATMCIGKWHLGDQPEFLPTRHGFDRYFGVPYSNDMMKKAKSNGRLVVPLVRDENVIELLEGADQDRLTERYTDEAIKFIEENRTRPFFLYLPHTAVHVPIHPGAAFHDKSSNGGFGDWVEEVDWNVGRMLETLRKMNLADNTLVMFSSDNGPWLIKGKEGGEAGPLRGGKGSTWEGGMREPTLAWWPGKIAPESTCDAVAGNIDFMPTFVDLAGGKVPTDRKIDGRSIAPLLLGKTTDSPHEAIYYYNGYKLQAVRVGPWKLTVAPQNEVGTNSSTIDASLDKPRLYNLDVEIGERTDVSSQNPEVVNRLRKRIVSMAAELGNGKPGPDVRKAGHVENPVLLFPTDDAPSKPTPVNPANVANAGKSVLLENLKAGDVLAGDRAPWIAGMEISIRCEVEKKGHDGVIVAQGGAAIGYTLYIREGRAVFAVHQVGRDIVRIKSPMPIDDKSAIEAQLTADGTLTLVIDGKQVSTGKVDGLLQRQPQESFCVGNDEAKPVDENYSGKTRFQGEIRKLIFKTSTER
jgi:arylsulfatase A